MHHINIGLWTNEVRSFNGFKRVERWGARLRARDGIDPESGYEY